MQCSLCQSQKVELFHSGSDRDYYQCQVCGLVFVPAPQFVSVQEAKAHYDRHENDPGDPQYRKFLSRVFEPVMGLIKKGDRGLDFGCGPGPTLSVMFEECGVEMRLYDPIYFPDEAVFDDSYDFITATEVFEHLHESKKELLRLWGILKPGGVLGVMTKLLKDRDAFKTWHYTCDPTHVCFFSKKTFEFLAEFLGADVKFIQDDVVLLVKR